VHGEAAVGGVRLALECNDQNAGSEGAPSRASTRMSARIIEGGGEHGGRPHDAPRYFHRRTIQGTLLLSRAYTRTADIEESEAGGTRGRSRCSTSRFATISAMSSSALWTRLRLTASVSKA
jgi:hypothetical protein